MEKNLRIGIVLLKEDRVGLREFDNREIDKIMTNCDLNVLHKLKGIDLDKMNNHELNTDEQKMFVKKNIEMIMSECFSGDYSGMDCVVLIVETVHDEVVEMLHKGMPLVPHYSEKMYDSLKVFSDNSNSSGGFIYMTVERTVE